MQSLKVLQSMWAMERRSAIHPELSIGDCVGKISAAGFDGVSTHWTDRRKVAELHALLKAHSLVAEGQCFPKTVDDLKPVLELATEFPVAHICVQPDVRPRTLGECIPLLEGWVSLGEEAGIPVYIETHRDRMTTDLFFTLDIIERLPALRLLGDISHFVVGREFAWPITEETHAYIHSILDQSWAFHGRVASREQVQIELSYPHHKPWLDLFLQWWDYGFRSWRRRAPDDASLAFVCELGPTPYAITNRDGEDTTDRWEEALMLKHHVRDLWDRTGG